MRKILITLMLISFGFMTPNANSFIFSSKKKNEDVHINEIWSKFNSGPHYELNKIVYLDEIVKSVLDENISFIYNPGGTVAYQILDSNVIEQYQNATNLLSSKGIKNTLIAILKITVPYLLLLFFFNLYANNLLIFFFSILLSLFLPLIFSIIEFLSFFITGIMPVIVVVTITIIIVNNNSL